MLLATYVSAGIQDFPLTIREVIREASPISILLGLIFAGLFVFNAYFREEDSVIRVLRLIFREYRDCAVSRHMVGAGIGLALSAGCLVTSQTTASEYPFGIGYVCWIISVLLLTPFIEEFLFRGILYEAVAQRFGTIMSVALSTTLFTGLHLALVGGSAPLLIESIEPYSGWILADFIGLQLVFFVPSVTFTLGFTWLYMRTPSNTYQTPGCQ